MHFLIDTNILIYRLKNMGNVNDNFLKYQNEPMCVSVVSYGELVYGAEKSKSVEKNLKTVHEIKDIFPLADITSDIMDVFGSIKAHVQKIGKTSDDMDLLIAATAIANEMTLVTHNTKHFEHIPNLNLQIGSNRIAKANNVADNSKMEQEGLTNEDMIQYLGSKSRVSEIFSRKRNLSLTMIRKLVEELHIPAEALLGAVVL